MKILLCLCILCSVSCSLKSLYSTGGAIVGGGTGALVSGGNIGAAALGAGAGSAAGSLVAMDSTQRQSQKDLYEALTKGDVTSLVDAKLESAKNNGFFDGVLSEVYGVIKLCVIGLALWILVPMIYTHWHSKKQKEKWKTQT